MKTTIYMDDDAYRRLQQLARSQGRPTAELVREAVVEYARKHAPVRKARSIGAGRSGRRNLSEQAEELLEQFGRDT